MYLMIGTLFEYDEGNKKNEKEMFTFRGYVTITRESNSDVFVKRIFTWIENKYEDLDNEIEGSRFSFKFVSKLNNSFKKLNEHKASSYIKSPNWLRYKNAIINTKNVDDRCFQYAFALTQHYKKLKNHSGRVSNIKPFLDLYN